MRYAVVDLRGNKRAQSGSYAELISELREVVREDPDVLRALYILEYTAEGTGSDVGRADEVLERATRRNGVFLVDFVNPGSAAPVEMSEESFSSFRDIVRSASAAVA